MGRILVLILCLSAAISLSGCARSERSGSTPASSTKPVTTADTRGGVEKVKPAPGTGNVQGKVLYNSKPAENIEVKLCEKFNQYFGGCSGKTFTARTDKDGEYVITNVEPKKSFLGMVGEAQLPASFATRVRNYHSRGRSLFCLHLAITEPPRYKAGSGCLIQRRAKKSVPSAWR